MGAVSPRGCGRPGHLVRTRRRPARRAAGPCDGSCRAGTAAHRGGPDADGAGHVHSATATSTGTPSSRSCFSGSPREGTWDRQPHRRVRGFDARRPRDRRRSEGVRAGVPGPSRGCPSGRAVSPPARCVTLGGSIVAMCCVTSPTSVIEAQAIAEALVGDDRAAQGPGERPGCHQRHDPHQRGRLRRDGGRAQRVEQRGWWGVPAGDRHHLNST